MFAVIGIACGLLAVVICKGLISCEAGFRRLPVSEFWHPIIGALGFAAVGLVVPRALGVGYDTINDILANRIAVGTLAVLLVGKLAGVVDRARIGHVGRHARSDPARSAARSAA